MSRRHKRLFSRRDLFRRFLLAPLAVSRSAVVAASTTEDILAYDIEQVTIRLRRLPADFDGYAIAQLSDIHYDGVGMRPEWLADVVQTINHLEPDLVVLTGDYAIDSAKDFPLLVPEFAAELRGLRAKDGLLAIMGNHDYRRGVAYSRLLLQKAGFRYLNDEVFTVRRGADRLQIAGLDDFNESQPDIAAVVAALEPDVCAIALVHEPDFADDIAATGRFDLQLSGHTHGGQVRMPDDSPVTLPRNGKKYHSGLYNVQGMWQYTNRGLGTKPPHFRVNCPPEVTLLTLLAGS